MPKKAINEFDCFYISYDEPQKEAYWAHLQDICPWAIRIDGVKGFDSAHKACANASSTDKFLTIDGDNLVYPDFFNLVLDIPDKYDDCTLSWASRNIINGLNYGNGGIKLWTKDFVLGMNTHENAVTEGEKVDFCWYDKYIQLNNTYSDTCPNGSPFQAFRAGFREGVKMTLDRGEKTHQHLIEKHVHPKNFKRLLIWATIGNDVLNGDWAIYGTRLGIYMANIHADFDIAKISDYDWFKEYFEREIKSRDPRHEATQLLSPLRKTLGLKIADIDAIQSEFFKGIYESPRRNDNPVLTEIEASQ